MVWHPEQSASAAGEPPRSICVRFWPSVAPAKDFIGRSNGSAAIAAIAMAARLGIDQRSRFLQILIADRRRGPEGERRDRAGRIVARVLRKCACTEHDEVGHVPALQKPIEGTG